MFTPMLTMRRSSLLILLTGCLLVYGCTTATELRKTLGDLTLVRTELIKKYGERDIDVRVNTFQNRTTFSVIYLNSLLNEASPEERSKRAQETAEIVKQRYPSIKSVSEIWVGFMRVKTRMVVFHWSEMIDIHGFDNEAHTLRAPVSAPVDEEPPGVHYVARENKTDIATSILLEGTPEKGVSVFPHFSVVGDVNKIKPKPPTEVGLDFAAYSEKPKFPNITKLVFISDDQIIYRTEGQFSTSKLADDMYSEFLYVTVPTAAFLKISSGSVVKIKLNDHEYTLREDQTQDMKRISNYLR